jgi:hypothetical protein
MLLMSFFKQKKVSKSDLYKEGEIKMSKMKKLLVVLTVMVSVIAAGLVIAASTITAGKTVEVTSAQKFTAAALGKGTVLGTVAKGTTGKVVKVSGAYANVKLSNSGLSGWVKTSALKITTIKAPITVDTVAKITTDWAASPHGVMPALNAEFNRDGCVQCHTGNGLEKFVNKDNVYKVSDAIKAVSGVTGSVTYDTTKMNVVDFPSAIGCKSCHSGNGAAIMKSGTVPAALNVYSNGNVQYAGTTDLKVGNANALCITCHNGRRDVKTIYALNADADLANNSGSYPHHAWGALASGLGGMEYPDETYKKSTMHQTQGCVGCHMGQNKSHKFEAEVANCKTCHSTMTSFEDARSKSATMKAIDELAVKLRAAIIAKVPGAVEVGTTNSTFPVVDKDAKQIKATTISSKEVLVGAYNYAIYKQEMDMGSKGIHNPQYLKSLLEVSIKRLEAAK